MESDGVNTSTCTKIFLFRCIFPRQCTLKLMTLNLRLLRCARSIPCEASLTLWCHVVVHFEVKMSRFSTNLRKTIRTQSNLVIKRYWIATTQRHITSKRSRKEGQDKLVCACVCVCVCVSFSLSECLFFSKSAQP